MKLLMPLPNETKFALYQPQELEIIKEKLKYATQKDIDRDINLMPIWVRDIVLKLWNS